MNLPDIAAVALAERLDAAAGTHRGTRSLAADVDLTVDDAYRIQHHLIDRKVARGEAVVGVKLGFTSRAKMLQMGVSDVIVGRLTDTMWHTEGDRVDLSLFIHPKIEPEVAFRFARDVDPGCPLYDVESHVDAVAPALEIIDSRYRDFQFTYADVVADNASASAFVLGRWQHYGNVDNRAVRLQTPNATTVGSTSAILGSPSRALYALVNMCHRHDIPLSAGDVVLAGAATDALPFAEGVTSCDVASLGRVTVRGVS